jgi:hydrogenase maturation protease
MTPNILVAGIGNLFLGDDGFGVEVVRSLLTRTLPDGVRVEDFGIRGMDLVYALLEQHDAVIFIDIAPRGHPPGTLSLLQVQHDENQEVTIDTHGMDPVKVLNLAHHLGAPPTRTYVIACEPALVLDAENSPDVLVELSAPVQAAIDGAVDMVQSLLEELSTPSTLPALT